MAKLSVFSPREDFTGVVAGVVFNDGAATVDESDKPGAVAYFRRHGYAFGQRPQSDETPGAAEDNQPDEASEERDEEVALPEDAPGESASRRVWADYAETFGVDPEGLTKAQLIEAVRNAQQ